VRLANLVEEQQGNVQFNPLPQLGNLALISYIRFTSNKVLTFAGDELETSPFSPSRVVAIRISSLHLKQ